MEVQYSKRALWNAQEIQRVLRARFSEKEVDRFHIMLSNFEDSVSRFPNLYPASIQQPNVKQAVLHKRLTVYYTFKNNLIYILAMKDNRQEQPRDRD